MRRAPSHRFRLCLATAVALLGTLVGSAATKNPTSKLYVADLQGDAEIDTGERVETLDEKSVYNAEGTVIQTKAGSSNAMVFPNRTGIYFAPETRLETRRFVQAPLAPNRIDLESEPTISQTHAFLPR